MASLSSVDKVQNLFRYDEISQTFSFRFEETAVAYGDIEASSHVAEAVLVKNTSGKDVTVEISTDPVTKWAINFAGTALVNGVIMYLPGQKTYDPAGITGDPHASEAVGKGCSSTQMAITTAQLAALVNGYSFDETEPIQTAASPIIDKFHGRNTLFRWMRRQIQDILTGREQVIPYPEFIAEELGEDEFLIPGREHTKSYLASYRKGKPKVPSQFLKKIGLPKD